MLNHDKWFGLYRGVVSGHSDPIESMRISVYVPTIYGESAGPVLAEPWLNWIRLFQVWTVLYEFWDPR